MSATKDALPKSSTNAITVPKTNSDAPTSNSIKPVKSTSIAHVSQNAHTTATAAKQNIQPSNATTVQKPTAANVVKGLVKPTSAPITKPAVSTPVPAATVKSADAGKPTIAAEDAPQTAQTVENNIGAQSTPTLTNTSSKPDNKTDNKLPSKSASHNQATSSVTDDKQSAVASKSEINTGTTTTSDDSKIDKSTKGPKTFDKESFIEAPIPVTNPWKKPEPVKPPAPAQTESKKPPHNTSTHNDRRKASSNTNYRGGPTPRSPRSIKNLPFHPSRLHQQNKTSDPKASHRKPLASSKSAPHQSSATTGPGEYRASLTHCLFNPHLHDPFNFEY